MATGVLHLDMLSQPCRAVALFCELALPAAARPSVAAVLIGRGATRAPSFVAQTPLKLGQVPLLTLGDGFALGQGTTIMRYLADDRGAAPHWRGGAAARGRARVDALCDFYHCGLRPHTLAWAYGSALGPRMGAARDAARIAAAVAGTARALEALEAGLAAGGAGFGDARALTIADLALAAELSQFALLPRAGAAGATAADGAEAWAALLRGAPRVDAWLRDTQEACGQPWVNAHAVLTKLRAKWAEADDAKERGALK